MVTKTVMIEFANARIKAADCYTDIFNACKIAKINLANRHHIILHAPFIHDGRVLFNIDIPDKKADGFNVGSRLRGISNALLACDNADFYKRYLVGNRLLRYYELTRNENGVMLAVPTCNVASFAESIVEGGTMPMMANYYDEEGNFMPTEYESEREKVATAMDLSVRFEDAAREGKTNWTTEELLAYLRDYVRDIKQHK